MTVSVTATCARRMRRVENDYADKTASPLARHSGLVCPWRSLSIAEELTHMTSDYSPQLAPATLCDRLMRGTLARHDVCRIMRL